MIYAHYDKDTLEFIGWYDTNIHTTIPLPNIEVSKSNWEEYLSMDNLVLKDGKFISIAKPLSIEENNTNIYNKISNLEYSLLRPMREILSSRTSDSDKTFALSKVDDIETQIQALRSGLK